MALIREFGDNYPRYHAYLAAELAKIGKRPRREDFGTEQEYLNRWQLIQEIVLAEAALRNCHGARKHGRALDTGALPAAPPLISPDDELVSIEGADTY